MKELIEKLKDKNYVRAFGLMSKEEQEVYRKVGRYNCIFFNGDNSTWENYGQVFFNGTTYAIKPDYQPEPEYVDLEIVEENGWLGIAAIGYENLVTYPFTHLHCLPSLPNFHCFWKDTGKGHNLSNEIYSITEISPLINKGIKVYARFKQER